MTDLVDLDHFWGADLTLGPTGDLNTVARTTRTLQRVLRRLLTNAGGQGDYIAHPEYGAGLAAKIGQSPSLGEIRAIVVGQFALEPAVAQTPAPQITVTPIAGGISISGVFYDNTGAGTPFSFSLNTPAS
jgi:hypothetical protein